MTPFPAPLPAYRQLARPCATLGCPNVLSAADRDGRCTACHDEAARAKPGTAAMFETGYLCCVCGATPVRGYKQKCGRCRGGDTARSHHKKA